MKRIFLLPLTAAAVWCAMPVHADEPVETDSMTPDSMKLYELQQIEVTATRVDRKTPVAYADIGREAISRRNFGSDMPTLLQMTPSVVATSDAGNGIGGTAFRLRGSDASRINVTTNGVPMNDAESHSVYWYDTPDMASSVGTIQVQRGAGTSTNGTGAFGGSVNMTTAPMSSEFSGEASLSYGSYNTNKQSLQIGSGLMGGHWTVDARLSHISSDGYVDRAFTNLESYMLQVGYYDGGTAVKLISFGGVARVGLAYDGVTKEQLETDRRYNSQGLVKHADGSISFYDNQTDNYTQINNQLIVNHRFNARWTLNVTGHYTYGSGYYNQYKNGQTLSEYGIAPIPTDDPNEPITESNLIRRKSMDNHFGGVVASANYTRGRVQLALGGAGNVYDGGHWGNVMSVVDAPGFPRHEYYRNASTKYDANVFAKINWEAARGLNLYADLQYRFIRHNITGTNDNFNSTTSALQELDIHRTYHFFNPKAGVNYTFARNHKVYVSFAVAQKEPTRSNFTDTKNGEYPTSERLYDWEFGYLFHNGRELLLYVLQGSAGRYGRTLGHGAGAVPQYSRQLPPGHRTLGFAEHRPLVFAGSQCDPEPEPDRELYGICFGVRRRLELPGRKGAVSRDLDPFLLSVGHRRSAIGFPCQRVQRPAAYAVCRQTILYQRPQRCAVARRLLCHQPEPGV